MLSFKALSEKKTKIKINPKQSEITEKKGCNHTKEGKDCPEHGMDKCPDTEVEEGYKGYSKGEVEPPKERLKTDRNMFNIPKDEQDAARERLKAKAAAKRKQLKKEEAYVSQEEVSEESAKEVAETETSLLTFGQFAEGLSIDDQMKISREHNRKSPEEKKAANKKAMGNVKKVAPKKTPEQMLRR